MNFIEMVANDPEPQVRTGLVYGVVVGIVTNNQDPDSLGRVKVKFPWLTASDESDWARVATPMAGGKRGLWVLPEVDDEVLVMFEHGDVRFPYVMGCLWNGVDAAPRDNSDGKNNFRVFRSRAGHELVFNDDKDGSKQQVSITTNAGHKILLDDSSGSENITIVDKSGNNQIVFDAVQNSIAINAQMKVSVQAQQIDIEAQTTMTLKAGAELTIQGALVKIN